MKTYTTRHNHDTLRLEVWVQHGRQQRLIVSTPNGYRPLLRLHTSARTTQRRKRP